MADYAIITNHTDYGMDLIQQDPTMASKLASETDAKVRSATYGIYGISRVSINYAAKDTWYDLEPLTASAKEEMRQASLGSPSIGFFDTIKKIISVILAVVAFVVGALVGGWALLAGALIAGGIILWNILESKQEYKQEMTEIDDEYARQLVDGEITQSQYDEFTEAKHKVMEPGGIPWTTIIIAGMVGLLALGALMILTRK